EWPVGVFRHRFAEVLGYHRPAQKYSGADAADQRLLRRGHKLGVGAVFPGDSAHQVVHLRRVQSYASLGGARQVYGAGEWVFGVL
ncbi:hypothetical protein LTR60_007945, partial [Cryomyces antarcticus]